MAESERIGVKNCGSCHECPLGQESPDASGTGWRLVASSAGVFLWPLLAALGGSMLGGDQQNGQLVGGILGFGFGAGVAWVLCRLVSSRTKRDTESL